MMVPFKNASFIDPVAKFSMDFNFTTSENKCIICGEIGCVSRFDGPAYLFI